MVEAEKVWQSILCGLQDAFEGRTVTFEDDLRKLLKDPSSILQSQAPPRQAEEERPEGE